MGTNRKAVGRGAWLLIAGAMAGLSGMTVSGQEVGVAATQPKGVATVPQTQPSAKAGATAVPQVPSRVMVVEVLDSKTREPVPGVEFKVSATVGKTQFKSAAKSDEKGMAQVLVPESPARYVSLSSKKADYVPMGARWPVGFEDREKEQKLPEKFTFVMQKGTEIGGRVLDDAGTPVDGATVMLSIYKVKMESPNQTCEISYLATKTGPDGKWIYKLAPEAFETASLGTYHPLYDSGKGSGFYNIQQFPEASVRDGSSVLTLNRGVPIEGVVVGDNGMPVANAVVSVGTDRVASNALPEIRTDKEGRFTMAGPAGQIMTLTVRATGHAPELKTLRLGDAKESVEFHLPAAKVMKLRVVDTKGEPIPGVRVIAQKWRNSRGYYADSNTNAEGRFVWKGAPADAVEYEFLKVGYADIRSKALVAGDDEQVIQMREPSKVTGTVVDAETGAAVPAFKLVQGIKWEGANERISWQRSQYDRLGGKDGKFSFTVGYPYPGYVLRVEAEGYAPADSRVYKHDEGKVELEFKLVKAANITGVVRNAEGKPVEGVELVMMTASSQLQLNNGRLAEHRRDDMVMVKSGADGKFSFGAQTEPYVIVALHDQGYAECMEEELAKSGEIKLKPWARVEGEMFIGDKPAVKQTATGNLLRGYEAKRGHIFHMIWATTDEQGRFAMTRVPAEMIGIGRQVNVGPNTTTTTHMVKITPEAGQTTRVKIGGSGRAVVGRVEMTPEIKALGLVAFGMSRMMEKVSFDFPRPEGFNEMTAQEQRDYQVKFFQTPEGKAHVEAMQKRQQDRKNYPVRVEHDGTFRIDDVQPGTYDLSLSMEQAGEGCFIGESLGYGATTVVVAEVKAGEKQEAVELPPISMKLEKQLKVGDLVPVVNVSTLDGEKLSLEQFGGKTTLVVFWATWCGPCVKEVPELKTVFGAYGGNEKFAMVSLSLDEKAETAKAFVKKQEILWPQGFLGSWQESPVPGAFGIKGIPSVWLIGPDGKVLVKNIPAGQLKETVGRVLGK